MIDLEKLKELLNDPETQLKWQQKIQLEENQKNNNIERVKKMFNDQKTFDDLMFKILSKNGDERKDMCYKKGYMPYPSTLLSVIFDLAEQEGVEIVESIDDLTEHFPSAIYNYNDWTFSLTFGQGTSSSIYYNKKLMYSD